MVVVVVTDTVTDTVTNVDANVDANVTNVDGNVDVTNTATATATDTDTGVLPGIPFLGTFPPTPPSCGSVWPPSNYGGFNFPPTTGGYGLTLTAARNVIYYSNSYNLEVRLQSEDRAHRIGQGAKVTYIDLIVKDSIDTMILGSLEGKVKISAKTLGEEVMKWL